MLSILSQLSEFHLHLPVQGNCGWSIEVSVNQRLCYRKVHAASY